GVSTVSAQPGLEPAEPGPGPGPDRLAEPTGPAGISPRSEAGAEGGGEAPAAPRALDAPRPRYFRAGYEMVSGLALGTLWYWIDRERNVADWDYDSWEQRLTWEAFRFDNNSFRINFLWHALSGSGFYGVSRANDLSLLAAGGYAIASSFVWEYLLEFREKISINDLIITPGAGIAIGEFLHRLSRYLGSSPGGGDALHRALRWIGWPLALHRTVDGHPYAEASSEADALGFGAAIAHRLELRLGLHALASSGPEGDGAARSSGFARIGFEGFFAEIPGYGRPGELLRFFHDAEISELHLDADLGAEGTAVRFFAESTLLGVHAQALVEGGPRAGARGAMLTAGLSMAYLYRREDLPAWRERLGLLGLAGVAMDGCLSSAQLRICLAARLHPAFAGVLAPGFAAWQAAHPDLRAKTILVKQGYYYGWGVWSRLILRLQLPAMQLQAQLAYLGLSSAEGLDRSQESVTADIGLSARRLEYSLSLRILPWGGGGFIELRMGSRHRRDRLEGDALDRRLDSFQISLGSSR
ncbi:MAG: DUF3943 domain-containing protein, partial [Myxococcales bacterium]|nr:DUF3943 domain-containing protein [Myxococcales bacterium]